MMSLFFLLLFFVPIAALVWRLVVSKTRSHWIRVGAAGAAMVTAVGAFVVYDDLADFSFKDWRADIGLVASMTGSAYLLGWAQRHLGNRRHRTLSIIAAIIGLVPVVGAILSGLLFGGLR
jgi:peptidoglycan/LPS O-acetylase OafA/YrhL